MMMMMTLMNMMCFLDTEGPLTQLAPWGGPTIYDDDDTDKDDDDDDENNDDDYDDDDVFSFFFLGLL